MRFFRKTAGKRASRPAPAGTRPSLEVLEARIVPYSTSGNAWVHPELLTISFVPDGTLMTSGTGGNVYSNLFSKFNARWSTQTWQDAVLTAAQTWAQYTNVNFSVVSDNGTASGQGLFQQGDPGMGDIRVGSFGFSTNYLGVGYYPPQVNNYSIAGDFNFNSNQTYNIGSTYDLQTVAMHEVGHVLGMAHSATYGTVMYASYNGTKRDLTPDDVSGVQAIYGARQPDAFDAAAHNSDFSTAAPLTALLDPLKLTAQLNNLDITTATDQHYYSFVAPATTSNTLTLSVQSSGLSLLRPDVSVYAADQTTQLAWTAGSGTQGSTQNLTVSGITAGQQYFIRVAGADSSAFSIGRYALTLGLGTTPLPSVQLPTTLTLNGTVLHGGGGQALDKLRTGPAATGRHAVFHDGNFESHVARDFADFYSINDAVEAADHAHHGGHDGAAQDVGHPGNAHAVASVLVSAGNPGGLATVVAPATDPQRLADLALTFPAPAASGQAPDGFRATLLSAHAPDAPLAPAATARPDGPNAGSQDAGRHDLLLWGAADRARESADPVAEGVGEHATAPDTFFTPPEGQDDSPADGLSAT